MSNAWQRPPERVRLSPDYIDVWRIPQNLDQDQLEQYRAILSGDELERCDRFKSEQRRREFIIGRGTLRTLIGQHLALDPSTFEFAYSEHQKPCLSTTVTGPTVAFNLTHSHGLVLIALTLERRIGIDIEYLRPDVDFRKLARRFFSKQESQSLEAYPDAYLPAAFFACWTRKEALLKAIGAGIAFGLRDFSVSVDPLEREVELHTHWDQAEAARWSILNLDLEQDYAAAVAASGSNCKLRCWDLNRSNNRSGVD